MNCEPAPPPNASQPFETKRYLQQFLRNWTEGSTRFDPELLRALVDLAAPLLDAVHVVPRDIREAWTRCFYAADAKPFAPLQDLVSLIRDVRTTGQPSEESKRLIAQAAGNAPK